MLNYLKKDPLVRSIVLIVLSVLLGIYTTISLRNNSLNTSQAATATALASIATAQDATAIAQDATATAQAGAVITLAGTATAQDAIPTAQAATSTTVSTTKTVPSPSPTFSPIVISAPSPEPQTLRILQPEWKNFVPGYDKWFKNYAQEWGDSQDVPVKVEITTTEIYNLYDMLGQEIEDGMGHDLVGLILPPHQFEGQLLSLNDLVGKVSERLGRQQSDICRKSTSTRGDQGAVLGFCLGHTPELSHFRTDLWGANGPLTYDELLNQGTDIKNEFKIKVGLGGYSVEETRNLDANNAIRAVMWSYGASVQNESQQVVINSERQAQMLEVIQYISDIYKNSINDQNLRKWHDLSNNICFTGNPDPAIEPSADCSYILNAILSDNYPDPTVEGNIAMSPPLQGSEEAVAPPHIIHIYVIPSFVELAQQEIAKQFLANLALQDKEIINRSNGYILPAWSDEDTLNELDDDKPILKTDAQGSGLGQGWSRNIGYPGPTNAAVIRVFQENILPNMIAEVIFSIRPAEEVLEETEGKICKIFKEEQIYDCSIN